MSAQGSGAARSDDHGSIPGGHVVLEGSGGQRAVIARVGATLRSWSVAGQEQLAPFTDREADEAFHGKVLAPWPNRIRDGRYRFAGSVHCAPITEPERNCALHGLALWDRWRLVRSSRDRVVLGHALRPQPGYPFAVDLEVHYVLTAAGLTVELQATNVGDGPAPFGAGFHPYLSVGVPVDDVVLEVPAATRIPVDERLLPVGAPTSVEGTGYDFRRAHPLGSVELDTTFAGLDRDRDGIARTRLAAADGTRSLTVWMDEHFAYVHVFTSDALGPAARMRGMVAIEPMTCGPDAFNSGEGLQTLAPGASFTGCWGISA